MSGTADDRYFEWLYQLVGAVSNRNPARSYWSLYKHLYTREFVWLVANDDNRIEDGKELRLQFLDEQGDDGITQQWLDLGCSMFEMLVALSRRASFESKQTPAFWFKTFMQNLTLDRLSDKVFSEASIAEVDEILDRVIYRSYAPDGTGGLFPLDIPDQDQTKVELWYQLAAYLLDHPDL